MSVATCLTVDQLRSLLLGEMIDEEAAPLEQHLLECEACVAQATSLRLSDVYISALRQAETGDLPAEYSRSVQRLVERLSDRAQLATCAVLADETLAFQPAKSTTVDQLIARLQPAAAPDELGRLGSFRVLKLLGRGGMGAVFLAEDTVLRRHVALKLLRPDRDNEADAVERFMREARAAAAVRHDNVVTIYQVGEANGVPFLAQELLEGETLQDRLKRSSPLPIADALRIAREIAAGLVAAHARGLLHRDIKPSNIWLERLAHHSPPHHSSTHHSPTHSFRAKLLDFGLARIESDDVQLTQYGQVVGTPAYMSPEQAAGKPLDGRSDLFSLGSVLYRMVTGRLPFQASDTLSLLRALAIEDPPPARSLNATVPTELSDYIGGLLAKDPASRPQSAADVVHALAGMETSSRAENADASTTFKNTQLSFNRRQSPLSLRRTVAGGLIGAITLACAAAVVITITRPDGSQTKLEVPDGSKIEIAAGQPASVNEDPQRRAALWILSVGGTATVQVGDKQHEVTAAKDLSAGDFDLVGVDLRNNRHASVATLAPLEGLTKLVRLHLTGAPVTDAGIENLRASPDISSLWLDGTQITDASLARIGRLTKLVNLSLVGSQVTDEGLRQLSLSKSIRFLYLSRSKVTDAGLPHLARMPGLIALHLDSLPITDSGLQPLTSRPLTVLRLRSTSITDAGLKTLAEIKTLAELNVGQTNVTAAGIAELQRALPKCKIEWDARTASSSSSPAGAVFPAEAVLDREAAQWVLRIGGKTTLEVDGAAIDLTSPDQLPNQPCYLVKIDLNRRPVQDHDLARLTGLGHLASLELGETAISDSGLKHLEALPALERLILFKTNVSDAGITALAHLRSLREFSLSETKTTARGWSRFGDLPMLTDLYLANLPLGDADLAGLASAQPQLQRLFLFGTAVTDAGMQHLSALHELRLLDLTFTKVTGRGLEHVGGLPHLEELRLPVLTAADEGARQLSRSLTLRSLRIHHESDLSDGGMIYLSRIKSLEELLLPGSDITAAGLADLAQLPKLRFLQLGHPPISDEAASYLSQLGNLESLTVAQVQTDKGLAAISRLEKLQQLRIGGKNLTDAGLAELARLRNLRLLECKEAPLITPLAIQALKAALPETDIQVKGRSK